jgi:hypothetical protein
VSPRRLGAVFDGRAARSTRLVVLAGLGLWVAAALAVQRWTSWPDAIRGNRPDTGFGADMRYYERIARAAPSFPDTHMLRPYAERFPVHWLVGIVGDATGIGLHPLYRIGELLVLALVVLAVHLTLARLELGPGEHLLALGVLIAGAYPVHYLLSAPGILSDAVFMLGLSVCLLGFVRGSFGLVLGGLLLSVLARQTGVPVALGAAVWVAVAPAWRHVRYRYATATALLPVGLWVVLHFAAEGFADPERGGWHDLTVIGYLSDAGDLGGHLGRVALGILVPCALVAGAWLRTRGDVPRGALLLAAAVVAQPLVLGPASAGGNETRLTALCVPALAVAAGALLRGARLLDWEAVAIGVAVFAAGFHHRYTHVGLDRSAWLALEIAGSALILAVLARPAARSVPLRVS